MPEKQPNHKPKPDPVEEASQESFPASDPPGWIGERAEKAATGVPEAHPMERLKQLANSGELDEKAHYQTICNRRDLLLTQAVVATAQALLKASGFPINPQSNANSDRRQAVAALEDYLADSSVPEVERRLLALVGIHALFGWKVEMAKEDDVLRLFPSGNSELDPVIVLRLAKALDRSPDQEALLWQKIDEWSKPLEPEMVKAAIRALLDERPVGEQGDTAKEMVIDNVLGG